MTSSLDDALERAQPTGDAIAREHVKERLASSLFGDLREPVRLGRFVLLERMGQGGMGTVYSAYDPELERRVALKLLHTGATRGGDRAYRNVLREARALARLSHPNVVPVHDVGEIDGRVFLVMEFVVGKTLREWLASAERSRRDVLEAYAQAGRGLVAAHAAGIVHRDFKPDNALVGDDGRVRVVDFGLARRRPAAGEGESAAAGPSPADAAEPGGRGGDLARMPRGPAPARSLTPGVSPAMSGGGSLTAPGRLVGTPRYMAPEQFDGADVGPAADQFAFCVALYEALYRQRPFADDGAAEDIDGVRDSVRERRVREPPRDRRVSRRLHAALCVGLRPRPEDRHASMAALLSALTRELRQTRWIAAASAVILAAALALVAVFASGRGERGELVETCNIGDDDLAAVWNQDRRDAIARAFDATGREYAEAIAPPVLNGLDRYGDRWVAMRRDACVRHRRGEQSGELLDRRMRCLDGRLRALGRSLDVLAETEAGALAHALQVVANLPSLASCADAEALLAVVPPPEDPAVARRVESIRARLDRVKALEDAGRFEQALAAARELVAEAQDLAYAPILAESLLAAGRAAIQSGGANYAAAVEPLGRAGEIAIANEKPALAAEALARRLYVRGMQGDHGAEVRALAPIAEALSAHVSARELARPLLFNNLGAVYYAEGDRERARDYYERALDALEQVREPPLELAGVRKNLAMITRDPDRRAALLARSVEELEDRLDPTHPWALEARLVSAFYTWDPDRARDILEPACAAYERYHDAMADTTARCLYHLAFLIAEGGALSGIAEVDARTEQPAPRPASPAESPEDRARALPILDRAAALGSSAHATGDMAWDQLARGWALYYRGEHLAALAAFQAVADRFADASDKWWVGLRVAHARLGIGMARRAQGRRADAARELRAAADSFAALSENNESVEYVQRRAIALAALRAIGGE